MAAQLSPFSVYTVGNLVVAKILNMAMLDIRHLLIFDQILIKGGVDVMIKKMSEITSTLECRFIDLQASAYRKAKIIIIGYCKRGEEKVRLNPGRDLLLHPEDEIIFLQHSGY
jgi:hypothetical protein